MSWLKVDDGFAEHPKIIDLTDRAFRLHLAALCFSARNLTDGVLSERSVAVCCALTKATRRHIHELVDAPLWDPFEDGYVIRDYLDYNPTAAKVKADREAARDRMRNLRSSGERSGEQTANVRQQGVRRPRPVPYQDPKTIIDQALGQAL